ncbi:hypothetical protein LGK97_16595 [Clostridium sp. CS001]|uniref:hypothetical protein n=1 Tax=Clostridium sp. CS001 TaxID=2880648 RepID=UPI001CF12202|nr:hypothetical protein [Clostridium sp. CS001]MCB2291347.1 hypothetical protein [Clostridium sp. CS001]
MGIDLKSNKFKIQYEKMSINSQNILNKLIYEVDKKSLNHMSTDTPDYRFYVNHSGKNVKHNYCLIKLKTREDLIKIHFRTDGYSILQDNKVKANKLDKNPYNGNEWYEVILKNEYEIEIVVDYLMQVYRNI